MNVLVDDLARAADRVELARTALGMEPDPWQVAALRSEAPRVLMNAARQVGKTTVASILALHAALYRPGALVLVLSKTERQGKELFRSVVAGYRSVGGPIPSEAENLLTLELSNASRVVVLPSVSGSIRGYSSVDLLILDEASRIDDETYLSARPMVGISGGRIVACSTPWGAGGWWADAWRHEGDAWERYEVPASQCPRLSQSFLAEERAAMGEWFFASEYECRFMDAQSAAFREIDIEAAFDPEVVAWSL